jgi:hypothetical protein
MTAFCVQLGKGGSGILQIIHQAYGDDAVTRAAVFKWCKHIIDREMSVKDEPHSSRPSTEVTDRVCPWLTNTTAAHRTFTYSVYFTSILENKVQFHFTAALIKLCQWNTCLLIPLASQLLLQFLQQYA